MKTYARHFAGDFMLTKFRRQCYESGVFVAAKNMRRQGWPIGLVLLLLKAL